MLVDDNDVRNQIQGREVSSLLYRVVLRGVFRPDGGVEVLRL